MVDAVVLDLDDTLIVEEATARAALAEALTCVGAPCAVDRTLDAVRQVWRSSPYRGQCLKLGIASWEGLWASFDNCHHSIDGLGDWAPEYRRFAWGAALHSLGANPSLADVAAAHYITAQRRGHPVIEGAAAAVRSLAHVPRCLFTNGPPDIQQLKLRQSGLVGEFDVIGISGAVGVGKPDPAAFAYVLDRIGVAPEKAVMVGDSWSRDIEGAIAVGMAAVWVSRGRQAPKSLPRVRAVDELDPSALESLSTPPDRQRR